VEARVFEMKTKKCGRRLQQEVENNSTKLKVSKQRANPHFKRKG